MQKKNKKKTKKQTKKQVTSCISTFKAAGNNNSKLKILCPYQPEISARNDWHFILRAYKYFLFQAFHAIPRETGAYISMFCVRSLLCRSIHASFVDFVLLFWSHYETTTKAKFIFYAKENGS